MTRKPQDPTIQRTSELGQAGTLDATGHELDVKETVLIGAQKLSFAFKKRKDTDEIVSKYLSGEAILISPRRLYESYRRLRALAYEKTGNLR